ITSVRKSPNMMSTTGRMPVIAAPTASPVMPASEIGESSTRSGPNSSTSPDMTLNGVPASATSSPTMKTRSSRRSSSASASLTACAIVISRVVAGASTLGVDIVRHLARIREGRVEREPDALLDLGARLVLDRLQADVVGQPVLEQPAAQPRKGVALAPPEGLLVLRAVVRPIDVADVVAVVAIGVAEQERRALASPRPLDEAGRDRVDGADVLAVDVDRVDAERARPLEDLAGLRLRVVRVLVVEIGLAGVDHRQRPEGGHVHHLVEQPLAERALAEEADGDLVGAAALRREGGAGGDPGRAAHDRVRAEVAVRVVGDVHRAALALAVAGLLAEQLGEHPGDVGALGQAVAVAAVGARDVVVLAQRRAHAHGDGLLSDVEVGEARHPGAAVELVHLFLEQPDRRHPAVHVEPGPVEDRRVRGRLPGGGAHERAPVSMPDIAASVSKRAAKSFSPRPSPRAAVS